MKDLIFLGVYAALAMGLVLGVYFPHPIRSLRKSLRS